MEISATNVESLAILRVSANPKSFLVEEGVQEVVVQEELEEEVK